jgi:autotransporter-associated beta strand protein
MIIKLHSKHLVFLISAMSLQGISSADTLYWDGTDTSQDANGGAGTWNVSDANWDSFLRGGTNAVWNNLAPDFAVFGGSSGTVALGGMINVSGVQFNTTGYTITASASNTLSFGGHSNVIFNNIAAATITGTVGGSGNLIFSAANPAAAGTLTLNGTSTGGWSGTTTINPSMTLSLSNDNQALNNTSGITLNGGGIILTNASATAATNNKINDSATITSNGGTLSIINTSGSGVYTETIGSVALTTGQLNIGLNNNHSSAGSQTLTLSGLTRTGASNTSAVTFSAFTTGPNTTKNMIAVTGAADGFLGAWATTGTGVGGAAQTDYAFITDVGGIKYVTAANIAATAENSTSWTAGGNNVTLSGAATLSGTRTLNTLRYTGNAQILALGANSLETYGILNGGSGPLTVSSASTGILTTPTGGGQLHLNAGNNAISVSTPINNNGGAVTLVKNGANTLTLSSTSSNYSGGTVINAGSLALAADSNLGASSGGLTFNGTGNITYSDGLVLGSGRTVTINEGANVSLSNAITVNGILTGAGSFSVNTADAFIFSNASNDFQGTITSKSANSTGYGLDMASIGDNAGAGLINLDNGTFRWIKASGGATTFTNRQFALSGTTSGGTISARGTSSAESLIINKDLLITGVGNKTLALAGTNLGDNTFTGSIIDGINGGTSIITVSKVEAGKWILSGSNTHTGGTWVNAGTLVIGNANALNDASFINVAGGTLESTAGTLTNGRFITTSGIISASLGGSRDINKFGTGTTNLNGTANDFTGGITVGGGTLAVGASSTLGQNVSGNSILIRDAGILSLTSAAQSGSNQAITLSSSSKSAAPVSTTGGGANAGGRLAVLSLGFNGLPSGAISQANTDGGVIAINGVTGYNTNLSTLLTGKNLFLGAIGTSAFTGAAGTVVAGNGSLYRLGGGGGTLTFNTTNLFTGGNGVQVGSTFVNGGGTVVISAAQDYTGVTTVSQGTLTFSGANGSATGSTGVTLNGGRLFLDSSGSNNTNRIGTVNVSLSNGGELSLSGNTAGTAEAFGDLGIGAGYSTVTVRAATLASSLAGGAFARTNNGTALFRGTSLGQQTGAVGRVTLSDTTGLTFVGTSTLNNAVNGDTTKDVRIIPYLVGGTTDTDTGSTFVTYDTTLGFRALTTSQFNSTITANTNVRLTAAATGIASNTINSLILSNSGTSTIADGATLTVTSGAILGTAGTVAINAAGTTGILDFGTAPGIVTAVNTTTIGARITGSGGLTKSGTGQLTLSSDLNSFSGGIVINGGTLSASTNARLGDASNTITVNGNATMGLASVSYARSITLNNGSILLINNETPTFTGDVTGTGGLAVGIGSGFSAQAVFSGLNNTFEGPVLIGGNGSGNANYRMTFASLADSSAANGRIVFTGSSINGGTGSRFEYTGGTGGNTNLVLNNRQIELASTIASPTAGHQIMNSSAGTGTLTIATDLIVSTPIDQTLSLRGTNTGANTFSGIIGNGDGRVSLLKTDAGRWILSGENTFTGSTVVSGGTLELANSLALQNSVLDTTSSLAGSASAGLRTTQTLLTFGGLNGNKNFAATGGVFTTTSGGYNSVTALTLNPGAGVSAFYSGVIENGAAGMSLSKTGTGTQVLSGIHTYTGATNVNAGTLELNGSTHASSTVAIGTAGTLTGAGTVNGNATLTGNGIINKSSGTIVGTLGVNGGFWNGNGTVGGLVTSSSGTFTISNSATLTATSGVSVTGGTVVVNGTLTGGLTAAADTTVYGSGTVTGTTTISGNHNPGNSPGIQTFENLSYTGGSAAVQWELNANSVLNSPVVFDQIIVEGDLDFAGLTSLNLLFNGSGSTVNWNDEFWASNRSWTIYDVAGTTSNFNELKLTTSNWLDGSGLAYGSSLNAGGSFVLGLGVNGNDVILNYTVIPEPKAALIGGLGILLLFRRRR